MCTGCGNCVFCRAMPLCARLGLVSSIESILISKLAVRRSQFRFQVHCRPLSTIYRGLFPNTYPSLRAVYPFQMAEEWQVWKSSGHHVDEFNMLLQDWYELWSLKPGHLRKNHLTKTNRCSKHIIQTSVLLQTQGCLDER